MACNNATARYYLPDGEGMRAVELLEWAAWFERADLTEVPFREGGDVSRRARQSPTRVSAPCFWG